ncbi:MAG: 5-formyltetrahydrofolate cyclo-ligase [Clostridiales bacterium]|nr:5-formyltetrahydrofolate cyclo-ligase [Clostridiales bacterium]
MKNVWQREKQVETKQVQQTTNKKQMRKDYLAQRKALNNRLEKDEQMRRRIAESDWYKKSDYIYTYVSYRAEADTKILIQQMWKAGKVVAVPRVNQTNMEFYQIETMDDLESGMKGILEPKQHCKKIDQPGVVLVPGAVFDRNGYRIGYGRGFYDRYISSHPNNLYVGLAYECQMTDEIPIEPWDKKINNIVTEEGIYEFN